MQKLRKSDADDDTGDDVVLMLKAVGNRSTNFPTICALECAGASSRRKHDLSQKNAASLLGHSAPAVHGLLLSPPSFESFMCAHTSKQKSCKDSEPGIGHPKMRIWYPWSNVLHEGSSQPTASRASHEPACTTRTGALRADGRFSSYDLCRGPGPWFGTYVQQSCRSSATQLAVAEVFDLPDSESDFQSVQNLRLCRNEPHVHCNAVQLTESLDQHFCLRPPGLHQARFELGEVVQFGQNSCELLAHIPTLPPSCHAGRLQRRQARQTSAR